MPPEKDGNGATLFRLPANLHLGRPVDVLSRWPDELKSKSKAIRDLNPFRPAWAGLSFTPPKTSRHATSAKATGPRTNITPYDVYQPDDRQTVKPLGYPWHCVGRILTMTTGPLFNGAGTGVLVGRRHVLTAGHCIPWDAPRWSALFLPGLYDGASTAGAGAQSWVSNAGGWNINVSDGDRSRDLAILRLEDPIGDQLGYFGLRAYNPAWQGGDYWAMMGYPSDIAQGGKPAYQRDFPILADDVHGDALELKHHADATPGASGSPIFGFWDGDVGPRVVGVMGSNKKVIQGVSTVVEDNNVAAGGVCMFDLAVNARVNWP